MTLNKTSRKTKIVCTLGPATASVESIRELIKAGMDVARLNFSHGDHDTHRETIRAVRDLSREPGKAQGILQDLGGPKIRLGKLPVQERRLQAGVRVSAIKGPESINQATLSPV